MVARSPSLLLRWWGLATAIVCMMVFTPAFAHGHAALIEVSPAADSVLDTAPTEVSLTFNEAVNPNFVSLAVVDNQGTNYLKGDARVEGTTISGVLSALPRGSFRIGYRVTSVDGHVISGQRLFVVGEPTEFAEPLDTGESSLSPWTIAAVAAAVLAVIAVVVWRVRSPRKGHPAGQ